MKKTFLAILLFSVAIISVRADLIWYDNFDYPDGQIILTSTNLDGSTNWVRHSGSGSDAIVSSSKEEISASGGTLNRSDDVNRPFATSPGSPYTNSQTTTYASFTVNCTNLPNEIGSYFAHFKDPSSSNFVGRVFALVGSSGVGSTPTNFTALPDTWRLGVSAGSNTADKVFPVDLALNTDYQVVMAYDAVNAYATLWVNPTSQSDLSLSTGDNISSTLQNVIQSAFAFRQGGSFGNFFCTISNLAVATTFGEAATNVWSTAPVRPVIAYKLKDTTNYVGSPTSLSVVANGQGLSSLLYQWRKGGGNIANPGGNTNVYSIASPTTGNSGNYDVIVTTPYGLSATSGVAFLWITNPPVPPSITQQPTNKTVYLHQNATFTVGTAGFDPHFQWNFNGFAIAGPSYSGTNTATLTIADVQFGNGTTGLYSCTITNIYGPTNTLDARLSVIAPPVTNIAYLRTLVDPVFYLPLSTTEYWTASGTVTTEASLTGGANASFYIQDDTAGIGVFISGGASKLPKAGENVTVTGPLSTFNGGLQFNLSVSNPATDMTTNSQNNLLPPGIVVPFAFTNGVGYGGISNVFAKIVGSVVTFTNVFFRGGGGVFTGGNATDVMTNQDGGAFRMFRNTAMTNLNGQPIPLHAWTVSGVMGPALFSNTDTNRGAGLELFTTRIADVVSVAPPAASGVMALSGGNPKVTWTAQPYMAYSIFRATNVEGPYVPLITGLTFNTTNGTHIDTNDTPGTRFYRIISP